MKPIRFCCFALCAVVLLHSNSSLGQTKQTAASAGDTAVSITGEVERPIKLTQADFAKLPRKTVRAKEHGGKESEFEGVTLADVLSLAGVKFGEHLRGKSLAAYLVVEAADGYKAVFALPELDPAFTDRVVILADKRDGKLLTGSEGPYRVVIPEEKRQARWVRQVIALTIRRA
jgi:DMSO/TMAO reductase YedYZ molybdopterin-dependent catalytic subunit